MEKLSEKTNKFYKTTLESDLKKAYVTSLKTPKFKALVNKFKLTDEVGMKYTSKLEKCVECLKNCDNCKLYRCNESTIYVR